jgi:outer membrane protein
MAGRIRKIVLPLFFIFGFALCSAGGALAAEGAVKKVLTLDDCIYLAVHNSTAVKAAEFEAEIYRSKKAQADAARYPQVEMLAVGTASPRARLKPNSSFESETNINKPSFDGVFGRADVQLIQPLYTFGKIDSYRKAGEHGVKAYEAGAKLKATEIALLVKEAYFGLLLGREIKGLLSDLKGSLDKATDKVGNQLEAEAPGVDQVDLFKLQTYQGELGKYIALADEGIEKAFFGLRVLTGIPEAQEFDISEEYLVPAEYGVEDYNTYRSAALTQRLEFIQLKEGLLAKKALVDVEKADYYPQVFLLGFYSFAGASNRDHLNNAYIRDEFNHMDGGAVLGLKWALDFGISSGQVREARAEYMKLKMTQAYAKEGVPFQVKEAYLQLNETNTEIKALSSAYKNAKQWLVTSMANFDLGVGEARDIADSVNAYGRLRADYFRAVFNQRMAIANLDHATGRDAADIAYSVNATPMKAFGCEPEKNETEDLN